MKRPTLVALVGFMVLVTLVVGAASVRELDREEMTCGEKTADRGWRKVAAGFSGEIIVTASGGAWSNGFPRKAVDDGARRSEPVTLEPVTASAWIAPKVPVTLGPVTSSTSMAPEEPVTLEPVTSSTWIAPKVPVTLGPVTSSTSIAPEEPVTLEPVTLSTLIAPEEPD